MPFGNNSELLQWCKDNGATSLSLNVALREVALANGGTTPAFNSSIFEFLRAAGYSGAFNDMWSKFNLDGKPLGVPGTYNYSMVVGVVGASGRGDQTGATMNPAPEFIDGPSTWTQFLVSPAGDIQLFTDPASDMKSQFEIFLNFPGLSTTEYRLQLNDASGYALWFSPSGGHTELYAYLDSQLGNGIDFKVRVAGVLDDLGTNEHWFRPEQNSSSYRGFDGRVNPGTYDPGNLARMDFTVTVSQPIQVLGCNSSGLFIVDCPASPDVTTPGPSVEFEGYNWGSPIALNSWNGFDFRIGGQTALYAYLGTIAGQQIKVRIIGPGV